MSYLTTGSFWAQTIERAVKTLAQTAVATISGNAVGLLDLDLVQVASVSGLAALLSVLTSIGSGSVGDDTTTRPTAWPTSRAAGTSSAAPTPPPTAQVATCRNRRRVASPAEEDGGSPFGSCSLTGAVYAVQC